MVDATVQFASSSSSGIQWDPVESTFPGGDKRTHPKCEFVSSVLKVLSLTACVWLCSSDAHMCLSKLQGGHLHRHKSPLVVQEFERAPSNPTFPSMFHRTVSSCLGLSLCGFSSPLFSPPVSTAFLSSALFRKLTLPTWMQRAVLHSS